MLNSIDSSWIRVVAAGFFQIDSDHTFPPGSHIHATTSISSLSPLASGQPFFATAWIVSYSIHLIDGSEGPRVYLPQFLNNSFEVSNCARITFRLNASNADARSLNNIYTL